MRRLTATVFAVAMMTVSAAGCSDAVGGDDPDPEGTLNIGEDGARPSIEVSDGLDFGRVQPGESAESTLKVENEGDAPLEVTDVTADGPLEVAVSAPGSGESVEIEPDEVVEWTVVFDAEDLEGTVDGEMTVESNDRFDPAVEIPWSAEVLVPCAEVTPTDGFDFGEVRLRDSPTRTVGFTNCDVEARLTVEVDGIVGDEAFELISTDGTDQPVELGPGESWEFEIVFDPAMEESYEANLEVTTDDPANSEPTVPLTGTGIADEDCVIPVIEAGVAGSSTVSSDQESALNAEPLDTVSLDGAESFDPEGDGIDEVAWSLVDRPEDSGAMLEHGADEIQNELYLDLAGTYVVELDAKNGDGEWACYPAHITIQALAGADIHVQLVWDTPDDPYRHNDDGADLDLHFLHPNGVWDEAPWDCHWQNPEPVWNDDEQTDGNPTLDVDETQGWGPENVNLDDPDPETDYRIGVNYFADRGYGESFATIRVFFEGELVEEIESPGLDSGEFWKSATVAGGLQEVDVVDEVHDGFPE